MMKEQDAEIARLTRDLAAAREELAAANATVEKCKAVASDALDHTENAMDTDEALARCKAGLRNVITAAEAARENNSRPTRQEGK
jgi:hypothetical protein